MTYCNLIVSTTHNNEGMNRAVKDVAVTHLSGQPKITEGMLNHVEVAIRAYDPAFPAPPMRWGRCPCRSRSMMPNPGWSTAPAMHGMTAGPAPAPRRILLIGYGNPGRGDDGLGPLLAARIEALAIPG